MPARGGRRRRRSSSSRRAARCPATSCASSTTRARTLPERIVGRLVFRGPSIDGGYFGKPEATAAITLPGGWLDSGDLAYLADGELHVCGRRKDLVIKGGRNLVPQEIEEAAAARRTASAAAASPPSACRTRRLGTESLVVVAETRADRRRPSASGSSAAVIERVAEAIDVPPDEVVLVPPGSVPKTSSGKVRRAAARELYLAGSLGRAGRTTLAPEGCACSPVWPATGCARLLARAARAALRRVARPRAAAGAAALPGCSCCCVPGRRFGLRGRARAARGSCCGCSAVGSRPSGLERLPPPRSARARVEPRLLHGRRRCCWRCCPSTSCFVAKREVRGYPLIGALRPPLRPPDRRPLGRAAERAPTPAQVDRALRDGRARALLPRGHVHRRPPALRPFRLGAFKAAAAAGVPVRADRRCAARVA